MQVMTIEEKEQEGRARLTEHFLVNLPLLLAKYIGDHSIQYFTVYWGSIKILHDFATS